MLHDGYTDLPPGKLANIVTYLEMTARPATHAGPAVPGAALVHVQRPELAWYRRLFARIGEPYLWFSRLVMSDDRLAAIVHDPLVEIYAVRIDGRDEGLLELDFRVAGECELAFLGLSQATIGRGLGRWLMNRALERAWSQPIARFWVHTCSLDHPEALAFYQRSGFVAFKRAIEYYDDPRLQGELPRDAAPDVPLL